MSFFLPAKKDTGYSGFSFIELLIVLAILGTLATIGLVGLTGAQSGARDGRRKSDLETIRSALELYRADCDRYPALAAGATPPAGQLAFGAALTGSGSTSRCSASNVYLALVPRDITSSFNYVYYVNASGSTYELCATQEKGTSSLTAVNCGTGTSYCGTGIRCYYKVTSP